MQRSPFHISSPCDQNLTRSESNMPRGGQKLLNPKGDEVIYRYLEQHKGDQALQNRDAYYEGLTKLLNDGPYTNTDVLCAGSLSVKQVKSKFSDIAKRRCTQKTTVHNLIRRGAVACQYMVNPSHEQSSHDERKKKSAKPSKPSVPEEPGQASTAFFLGHKTLHLVDEKDRNWNVLAISDLELHVVQNIRRIMAPSGYSDVSDSTTITDTMDDIYIRCKHASEKLVRDCHLGEISFQSMSADAVSLATKLFSDVSYEDAPFFLRRWELHRNISPAALMVCFVCAALFTWCHEEFRSFAYPRLGLEASLLKECLGSGRWSNNSRLKPLN